MGMATRHVPGLSHPNLPSDLQPVVGSCFSLSRSPASASVQACCCIKKCLCHVLGSHVQRACSCRALYRASVAVAYQLPQVCSSMAYSVLLQTVAARRACYGPYEQHCDHCVHQPPRRLHSRRMSQLASHILLCSQKHLRLFCYDPLISGCNIKVGSDSSHKRYKCQLFYLIKLKQHQSVMTIEHKSRDNEENRRNKYNNQTITI